MRQVGDQWMRLPGRQQLALVLERADAPDDQSPAARMVSAVCMVEGAGNRPRGGLGDLVDLLDRGANSELDTETDRCRAGWPSVGGSTRPRLPVGGAVVAGAEHLTDERIDIDDKRLVASTRSGLPATMKRWGEHAVESNARA